MKTKQTIVLLVGALHLAGFLVTSAMASDELPGVKRFNVLVREANQAMNQANREATEKQAKMAQLRKADALVPEAQKAKDRLEKTIQEYQKQATPETSEALQRELVSFAKANADYIEIKREELALGRQMLDNLIDQFSKVTMIFAEMEAVAQDIDATARHSEEYRQMEKAVVGLADMIDKMESFADPYDIVNLRNTLEMQAKIRLQEDQVTANLTEHLRAQAREYTLLLSQMAVARDSLVLQQSMLSRVGLMKIAENLLLKTSYVLIGSVNISDFPTEFLARNTESMKSMQTFAQITTLGSPKRGTAGSVPQQSSYLTRLREQLHNREQ